MGLRGRENYGTVSELQAGIKHTNPVTYIILGKDPRRITHFKEDPQREALLGLFKSFSEDSWAFLSLAMLESLGHDPRQREIGL